MRAKIMDLRPNARLLEPNFDGYKLSLNNIPINEVEIANGVEVASADSSQYSYLHLRLFGGQNHLEGEEIGCFEIAYFVDKQGNVRKAALDLYGNDEVATEIVYAIPQERNRRPGDYNPSLKLVNKDLVVLSNGLGRLFILSTGNREENYSWNCLFNDAVLPDKDCFIIQDCLEINDVLHCLLLTVKQGSNDKFGSVLFWVTFKKKEETYDQIALRELYSKGCLIYASFENDGNAIYVMSDEKVVYTVDSENPLEIDATAIMDDKKKFVWFQDENTITVQFKLPENFLKEDLIIQTTNEDVFLKFKDLEVLSGKLLYTIDSEQTKWSVSKDSTSKIEIILSKTEKNQMWSDIVPGNTDGEFIVDAQLAEEVHKRLEHFCADKEEVVPLGETFNSERVEECDFTEDKSYTFQRLCLKTHMLTHSANVSGHQVVLTVKLSSRVPAFALRHDVDACLWQPELEGNEFNIRHSGTLHAFGYIQASKQQRKFTTCAPDLSYSVICEGSRYVFIYRQKMAVVSGELRQRSTGRRIGNIAQQQMVNLGQEDILGIYATNKNLFILCQSKLYVLRMAS